MHGFDGTILRVNPMATDEDRVLWCLLEGDSRSKLFKVTVPIHNQINDLKKRVWEERKNTLKYIPAKHLVLSKVNTFQRSSPFTVLDTRPQVCIDLPCKHLEDLIFEDCDGVDRLRKH